MDKVTILLSTYNGEKYLSKQIESILAQNGVDVKICIRDDCSLDKTKEILKKYKELYPTKIKVFFGKKNLGACKSFLKLISKIYKTEYIALADQDDIWDKDKLISAINMLKSFSSKRVPALYYSNLRIVDENNNYIRDAHRKQLIAGEKYSFLVDPLPTGCTIVYNSYLAQIAKYVPDDFSMHDVWLYSICSLFGKCIYDFKPYINYRQHNNNVVGTYKKTMNIATISKKIKKILFPKTQPRYENAIKLYNMLEDKLSNEQKCEILKIVDYKKSWKNTIRLFCSNEYNSASRIRCIQFKIKVLLRNI